MSVPTLAQIQARPVPTSDHEALALRAQSGDNAAYEALLGSFIAYLRKVARSVSDAQTDDDDIMGAALVAFADAINEFQPGSNLVGLVRSYVVRAVTHENRGNVAASVPTRTLARYFAVVRAANGDIDRAREIAPDHDLAQDTFDSIAHAAVDTDDVYESSESGVGSGQNGFSLVEEAMILDTAWSAVDDFETDVLRLYYGFSDYRENSDDEVGRKLGGYDRSKIRRTRVGAIDKMRDALGLDA